MTYKNTVPSPGSLVTYSSKSLSGQIRRGVVIGPSFSDPETDQLWIPLADAERGATITAIDDLLTVNELGGSSPAPPSGTGH